ncbi:NAD(P)/FAD-dependent oxidoreductase [Litoreibacter arenae]|uniref:Oxidoreductase, FAD-binding protein n=1 Tax=Litoreibacter arenae DSM 19593 TaxID=1123360 RepID=S9Q7C0_9RHOB|nr:FAD-dependent oxidoreductase [Litoreibacter arenae]EPX77281.1 Oxidoreductase, FAD-binding protein [Litoreibacter arenae DSM 19593]
MSRAEVTVLGAGAFGLSVAWACVQRGARVRVIDPNGVASGASGGIVGALAPHTPEQWNDKKQFQLESLLMAETFWQEVEDASGLSSGYGQFGRIQPVLDEAGLVLAERRAASARELWGAAAEWRVEQASGDWCLATSTGQVIVDTLSARLHPRQACLALAGAIQAAGSDIVRDGPQEGAVVHATGYEGLEAMTAQHTRQVGNGVKGQAALLEYDARDLPQLYFDGLHVVPHADGTVAIGSTSERYFEAPASTDAQLDDILSRAVAGVPLLGGAQIIARWAGVRPRARSRAPMLGAHPFENGAFVANGGFKIGFGVAPKVAQVMADLVLDGVDRIPPEFQAARCL